MKKITYVKPRVVGSGECASLLNNSYNTCGRGEAIGLASPLSFFCLSHG